MEPYAKFAEVYDRLDADRHSLDMVTYTLKILKRMNRDLADIRRGLDLCCGTGSALAAFLDHGIPMDGLDRSAAMLRVAKSKLAGRGVALHRQALPEFIIKDKQRGKRASLKHYDLVTSFYDSLNYLLIECDLTTAFRSVYRHLAPRGLFIFDMNTPNALKTIWGAQTWAVSRPDIAWIFRNEYHHDNTSADCHVTIFYLEKGKWLRLDEVHTERGYANAAIRRMLHSVGFRIRGFYRCGTYQPATKTTNRICVIAERPS